MPSVKEEDEGVPRRGVRHGIDKSQVLGVSTRIQGRVALRSDISTFQRTLRERKEEKATDKDDESVLSRPSPAPTTRKRVRPPALSEVSELVSSPQIISGSQGGGGADGGIWRCSSGPSTPTPRSRGVLARSMDLENAGEGGTEIRSPSWSYLEGSAEEMTSRNLPHAAPVLTKIRMGKLFRALCAELLASQDGEKAGVAELKASLLHRVNAFHYRSWHAFKSDFDVLMRKHCGSMSASSIEALKGQMSTLLGRYKAMCGDPSGAAADPKKIQGYATLTQVRDELCANLKSSEYVFFKPEADPAASVQKTSPENVVTSKGKERVTGLGKGKRPVVPPYQTRLCPQSDEEEDGDYPSSAEPLVILKQPPPTFVSGMYGGKDHHFEVEVRVPDAMRKRMQLESAVPLVVELRYEDGEAADQQHLHVLEEPVMHPGTDKWVVKASINATSFKHGKRRFALWLDVSQFEQRGHSLWIQGVLTDGINVVSSGVSAPVPKRRTAV